MRDGKEKTISLTLGEPPDEFSGQTTLNENDGVLGGMTVAPLTDVIREKFEIKERVSKGSPLQRSNQEALPVKPV